MNRTQAIAEMMRFYPHTEDSEEVKAWRKMDIKKLREVYVYLMYINPEEAENLIVVEDDENDKLV